MYHNIKSRYILDFLTMLLTCNVQEKAERVFALIPTKIAFKRFPAPVVSHVDAVHHTVSKSDATKLARSLICKYFL